MSVRVSDLAQLGPWVLLGLLCLLAAVFWLIRLVLGKQQLPDKDLWVEIGPLKITYTTRAGHVRSLPRPDDRVELRSSEKTGRDQYEVRHEEEA